MNVAIISQSLPGTTETFIKNHIEKLPFNITLIHGTRIPYITTDFKERKLIYLFFRILDYAFKNNLSYNKYFLKKALKKNKIDLVLAEYINTAAYITPICKKLNIPIVATGLGYEISVYDILKENEQLYKDLINYCKHIVIVSKHMLVNLKKFGGNETNITHSAAGPESSFFDIEPSYDTKTVLAIGRFVEKKAPHITLLAFHQVLQKIPDAQLLFAGDGPLFPMCKDIVKSLGMEKNVQFIGYIDQEQQKQLLAQSCIFVQHSKIAQNGDSEGTPVALLEASAAKVPIVSTKHGGIVDIVEDGKTGFLVDEGDMIAMANHMINLLSNPDLAKEMGTNGRTFVRNNFTLDMHIETLTRIIRS